MHRSRGAAAAVTLLSLTLVLASSSGAHAAPLPSSTAVTLSFPESSYGQTVTATATVVSASGPAEGDVVFSVDGVAKKVNLGASGTGSLVLPRALVGEHAVSATYVPQFPQSQQGSTSPTQTWSIAQARTRLQVRVIGRGARIPTSVRVGAAGDYGTRPTGRVRFVVRRAADGKRVVAAQRLDPAAVALVRLGKLRKGKYRLEVTYVGDSQHLRERHTETFGVRQR